VVGKVADNVFKEPGIVNDVELAPVFARCACPSRLTMCGYRWGIGHKKAPQSGLR
jgi:hypothetical protein